jgi:hypothetical protein
LQSSFNKKKYKNKKMDILTQHLPIEIIAIVKSYLIVKPRLCFTCTTPLLKKKWFHQKKTKMHDDLFLD